MARESITLFNRKPEPPDSALPQSKLRIFTREFSLGFWLMASPSPCDISGGAR